MDIRSTTVLSLLPFIVLTLFLHRLLPSGLEPIKTVKSVSPEIWTSLPGIWNRDDLHPAPIQLAFYRKPGLSCPWI